MDGRNYDEPYNFGLDSCDCREDNTCGCTFPNNISNMTCPCINDDYLQFSEEKLEMNTPKTNIKKETVCVCSPKECDCTIERNETEKKKTTKY